MITGAARGMGLGFALRLAEEGADIIALDLVEDDLAEVVDGVRGFGRRVVARAADVRDFEGLTRAVDAGVAELGRLDIVAANAGIAGTAPALELTEAQWRDMLDVNLTGVWSTCRAAVPHIISGRRGGSVVITSSVGGLRGMLKRGHYVATKHAVVGLARTLAAELGPEQIRVNTVHPTRVDTPMLRALRADPDPANPISGGTSMHLLPIEWIEVVDVANAVLFLASDEARYVTGVALPVDAGRTQNMPG
ncbi:MAG: mycofactocin-coupled SDR family oxidoreductase [Mycobacteriales bacterium]